MSVQTIATKLLSEPNPLKDSLQKSGDVTINLTQQATTAELSGSATSFGAYLSSIFSAVMVIAALMVLFYFVWGAIEWITSGGDQSKIQKGRDKITQSVVGIIVLSATIVMFMVVQNFLGLNILGTSRSTNTSNSTGSKTTTRPGVVKPTVVSETSVDERTTAERIADFLRGRNNARTN